KDEEAEQAAKKDALIKAVTNNEQIAQEFHENNDELDPRSLMLLRSRIGAGDNQEQILQKVLELYPDPFLADEALDYLSQTTDGELKEQVLLAKQSLNSQQGKDVRAGRNIQSQTQEFSKQGVGSPGQLRGIYKEITGNPKDANTL